MEKQTTFMQAAIDLGRQGMLQNAGGPFGCVIVKDDVIIGRGWNRVTSDNDPTAHAEVMAIRDACKHLQAFQLAGCDIYTSCEPCPMCLGAIYWARISEIYYANTKVDAAAIGFDDQFIYDEIDLPMDERKLPHIQLMHEEALHSFKLWETSEKKIDY